ncbi:T9SS type A sorting domain-containing protein [bacterium]|nr:T9SS type A sorting domain-containing protein [bacterium]
MPGKWPLAVDYRQYDPFSFAGNEIRWHGDTLLSVRQYLKNHFTELGAGQSDVALVSKRATGRSLHYSFCQTYQGIPVLGTEIKVNTDRNLRITSLFVSLVPTADWQLPALQLPQPKDSAVQVVYFVEQKPAVGWRYHQVVGPKQIEVIAGNNKQFFYRSTLRYHHSQPDSILYLKLFEPDPLTTAKRFYGGAYRNHGDSDVTELNNERTWMSVRVHTDGDSLLFANDHVRFVRETGLALASLHDSVAPLRSEQRFENLMILYHITAFKRYLASLGYQNLVNYAILVNPHAFTTDDSAFIPIAGSNGKGKLKFGYCVDNCTKSANCNRNCCHVDDAEDADVIVHEFGHAISFSANGNDISKLHRKSIDEGLADYFACSYSSAISFFNQDEVFNWDGHNEFWEGRTCVCNKTMDDFIRNMHFVHSNGEILSSALVEISRSIGRTHTDVILLQTLYDLADNMKMEDFARLFIQTESTLFASKNEKTICSIFSKYKLIDIDYCGNATPEVDTDKPWVHAMLWQSPTVLQVDFEKETSGTLRLFDVEGRLVYQKTLHSALQINETLTLPAGVYTLQVTSAQGAVYVQKLVRY